MISRHFTRPPVTIFIGFKKMQALRRTTTTCRPYARAQRTALRCFAFQKDQPPREADVPKADVVQVSDVKIKVGDKIPANESVFLFEDNADAPRSIPFGEIVKGKKAVIFGLPGAYTSVCSSKHVPEYMQKRQLLFDQGVDLIGCLSVNDAYVMKHWATDLGVDTKVVRMLGDPDASLHRALGLTQVLPGLGERARRYSMYLEDGVVKILNIDEPGGKSYKVSGPSNMEACIKRLRETGKA